MKLKPRQYVFIAAILALATFNIVRLYRAHHAAPPAPQASAAPRGTSPIWAQYDTAAAARDAAPEAFLPALSDLTNALNSPTPVAQRPDLAALNSCRLWLLFYRQEFLHPDNRTSWKAQTLAHTTACMADHADSAR